MYSLLVTLIDVLSVLVIITACWLFVSWLRP